MKSVLIAAAVAAFALQFPPALACEGNAAASASPAAAQSGGEAAASRASHLEWQYHYVGHHPRLEGHWVAVN